MAVTELGRKATVACPFCTTLNRVDLGRLPDRPKCGHCGRPILVDRPVAVTDATVEAVLAGTTVPVVMDCYADWCGPCKIMAPVLDDLAHERAGEVLVTKLDTDRNEATAQRFNVRAIPTLIVFREGREVARHAGVLARRATSKPVTAAACAAGKWATQRLGWRHPSAAWRTSRIDCCRSSPRSASWRSASTSPSDCWQGRGNGERFRRVETFSVVTAENVVVHRNHPEDRMRIGVPKETAVNERRVALTPEVADRVVKSGLAVLVERDAGAAASFGDDGYRAAGATVVATAAEIFGQSDVVLKVQPPSTDEVRLCRAGAALVAVFQPSAQREAVTELAARHVTAFSLALLPRITRAQPMDVLSSQATVAGYKSVLLAAAATGRFFPMLVTAAGTLPPARALVVGAGVAGLPAIATARRLGAGVSAFDVGPAGKGQGERLGAKVLGLEIGEAAGTAGGYAEKASGGSP